MAKLFSRVWEAFKSLLILLLAVSSVYLTYQLLVGSGTLPFSSPITSAPLSSAAPLGSVGVPRPIRMAVTNTNGRHGVQYDDTAVDELCAPHTANAYRCTINKLLVVDNGE